MFMEQTPCLPTFIMSFLNKYFSEKEDILTVRFLLGYSGPHSKTHHSLLLFDVLYNCPLLEVVKSLIHNTCCMNTSYSSTFTLSWLICIDSCKCVSPVQTLTNNECSNHSFGSLGSSSDKESEVSNASVYFCMIVQMPVI